MPSIMIVGEAWGAEEELAKAPFMGAAGQELTRQLKDAGLERKDVYLTNVFNARPPNNDPEFFFRPRKEGTSIKFPTPLHGALCLKPEHEHHVERLIREVETVKPNLVILFGNTACWALLGETKISKLRGAVSYSNQVAGVKCLPTYHPSAVLRQYELRHTVVLDLMKAKREAEFPEIRRPIREVWLDPTLQDIRDFLEKFILPAKYLACDIETNYGNQITCIGFAPSIDRSICIPFYDLRPSGREGSYWHTLEEELEAWKLVQEILLSPPKKIFQNGMFDMQHMWQNYGLRVANAGEDTMLMHHSLHPEAPKALDFLGSIYCNEVAWKTMRPKGRGAMAKRND